MTAPPLLHFLFNTQLKKKASLWIRDFKPEGKIYTPQCKTPESERTPQTDHPIWLKAVSVGEKRKKNKETRRKESHRNLPSPGFFVAAHIDPAH